MDTPNTSYNRFQQERYGNVIPESKRGFEVEDLENNGDKVGTTNDPQEHIEYEQSEDEWFPDTNF